MVHPNTHPTTTSSEGLVALVENETFLVQSRNLVYEASHFFEIALADMPRTLHWSATSMRHISFQ